MVKQFLDSPGMNRAIQIIAVASLVLALFATSKQYALTDCLARYNDAVAKVNAARVQAAEDDRRAQDAMFNAVVADPQTAIAAVRAYNAARAAADKKRAENPAPSPPSQRC